jgi:hypothetical protein
VLVCYSGTTFVITHTYDNIVSLSGSSMLEHVYFRGHDDLRGA